MVYTVQLPRCSEEFPVAMRLWETPVPIPNTMVKTQAADGTMLGTAWESRWLPGFAYNLLREFIYNLIWL